MSTHPSGTDPGSRSAADIERDVQQSRANIEHTLDAIQERLSPGQLVDQAIGYFRGGRGVDFARNLGDFDRSEPDTGHADGRRARLDDDLRPAHRPQW